MKIKLKDNMEEIKKMKKLIAILLIATFVFSLIPLSIANGDDDDDLNEHRMRLRKEKLDDDDFKERIVSDEEKFKFRENSLRHKEMLKNNKLKAEEFRLNLETNKLKIKECRNVDTSSCRLINRNNFEIGQNYLLNIVDALINHLNFVKEKVQSSEELSDEEANEDVNKINDLLSKLEELKKKINEATNREQLIEISSELRSIMKNVRTESDYSIEHIRHRRIGEILERAEHLEAKLARIQDRFGINVTNSSELNSLIQEFNDKIDDAREKYWDAVEIFEQARSANDSDARHDLVRESHDLFKEAHEDLKDAHNILKDIFRLLKGIDRDIDFNRDECWNDRPLFRPGKDLGYFVWRSNCTDKTWVLAWSGDARLANTTGNTSNITTIHHMTGTITTNGVFSDIKSERFESGDKFNLTSNNTITFDAYVSTHFDELRFETSGTEVTFDLFVDGERNTSLVYIGKNWTNPSSIPFTRS